MSCDVQNAVAIIYIDALWAASISHRPPRTHIHTIVNDQSDLDDARHSIVVVAVALLLAIELDPSE